MLPRAVLDLLVPPLCLVCRAPGGELCGGCRGALPWLLGPCCARCGLPSPCGRRCPAAGHAYTTAWAPLAHEGPARALVAGLKFRRATAAADVLAAAMAAAVPEGLLDDATLVPVPAHPGRRRIRGYDQALLLARRLGRRTATPVAADALRRKGGRADHQLGAGRQERLSARRLQVGPGRGRPRTARVVLVDDVHTTGATLHACAQVLVSGGVREVVAVTAVRALRQA